MSLYNSDGKINTTTVNGLSWTGLYATDGSVNVVLNDVTSRGSQHPCGALRVNSGTSTYAQDNTGAYYSNHILGAQL